MARPSASGVGRKFHYVPFGRRNESTPDIVLVDLETAEVRIHLGRMLHQLPYSQHPSQGSQKRHSAPIRPGRHALLRAHAGTACRVEPMFQSSGPTTAEKPCP